MKKYLRVLGAPLVIGLLLLVSLVPGAFAANSSSHALRLPLKPQSTGFLVAQGIHNGTIKLSGAGASNIANGPNLFCGPAPCIMLNHQASEGGNIQNETPVTANPTNGENLLSGANDYNCNSLQGFYESVNAGKKWNATCMNTLPGAFGDGDPGVAFDRHNTAYITGIDGGTSDGYDIVYEKSSDGGVTWSAPAVAVRPFYSGGLTDKDWLWSDTTPHSPYVNALYVSVTQFDANNNTTITVSHSDDGGATWTTTAVDSEQFYPTIDQFSDITTGKDGTVYATWMRCTANGSAGDCGGTVATMMMSKSSDGGNTWSAPKTIASVNLAPDACFCGFYGSLPNTSERVSDIPAIGADNSTGSHAGNLYTVMYTWTGTFMEVEVSVSTNGGSTWGSPVVVSPGQTHDQFFPWLSVNNIGDVGVTWLDRRNDPSNLSYQAFSGVSFNGGTGYHVVFITHVLSNPLNDGFGGGFMGDYTGNTWVGNKLYATWSDTRNGSYCVDEIGGRLVV